MQRDTKHASRLLLIEFNDPSRCSVFERSKPYHGSLPLAVEQGRNGGYGGSANKHLRLQAITKPGISLAFAKARGSKHVHPTLNVARFKHQPAERFRWK
jgi:hypothetical protein